MPVAKPTKTPRWASAAGAVITEPTEGKKDIGDQVEERPPAQYRNWVAKITHDWVLWLQDIENQALIWNALQTFNAEGDGTNRTKVFEFKNIDGASTDPKIRVYAKTGLNEFKLEIVGGAEWNEGLAQWVPDNAAAAHICWMIRAYGLPSSNHAAFRWLTRDSSLGNFADSAWALRFNLTSDGNMSIGGDTITTSIEAIAGPGALLTYTGFQFLNPSASQNLNSITGFRKRFPSAPSSNTVTTSVVAINVGPSTISQVRATGLTNTRAAQTGGSNAHFLDEVTSS